MKVGDKLVCYKKLSTDGVTFEVGKKYEIIYIDQIYVKLRNKNISLYFDIHPVKSAHFEMPFYFKTEEEFRKLK